MAYNPTQMFPGAVDLTDPNFVNGKYKDSSAPGVLDGTPLQAIYFNQRLSMEQAFMDEAGEAYSDSADDPSDSQVATAIKKTYPAINKIKTSQFVVEGTTGDPLPTTSATSYLAGAEMAFGWVVTTDVVDAIIDANGNLTATSGVVEYTFDKADNETPNAASLFASVMRCTDAANSVYVQDYADGSNGISLVNETTTTITLRIDFSSFAGGKIFGVSEQYGRLPIDSVYDIRKKIFGVYSEYFYARDEKPNGTNGGTPVIGTNTRDINTIVENTIPGASLSSNQITLTSGVYSVKATCPNYRSLGSKAFLQNITDGVTEIVGTSSYSDSGSAQSTVNSYISGILIVSGTKVFELLQVFNASQSGNGLGVASSASSLVEVYSEIEIMRLG